MNYFINVYLISFILIILTIGCSSKRDSTGNYDEIIVFADSLDWKDYKEPLNSVFGRYYKTPVLEREYLLSWQPAKQIDKFKNSRNVFFLGRMNSEGLASTIIKNSLSKDVIDNVNAGKIFYIPKHNVWALDQYVLFLLAPNKNELVNRISKYGEAIYDDFEKSYYRRIKEELYRYYENKKLEGYLEDHFPFKVRIPSDYFIANESVENNFVWIRRLDPDRSLMVHWIPYNDSINVDYDWVVKERNRIAKITFEGDVIVEDETESKIVKFEKWQALRLEGTWKNPKYMVGGPFRNMTFTDNNLIFMVDLYVRAIGQRKKMFLDQLEVIAHTFQSKSDLESK